MPTYASRRLPAPRIGSQPIERFPLQTESSLRPMTRRDAGRQRIATPTCRSSDSGGCGRLTCRTDVRRRIAWADRCSMTSSQRARVPHISRKPGRSAVLPDIAQLLPQRSNPMLSAKSLVHWILPGATDGYRASRAVRKDRKTSHLGGTLRESAASEFQSNREPALQSSELLRPLFVARRTFDI